MKITISFLHLDHTPALDERIQEKSMKLNKYLNGRTHLKWSCFVKDGEHTAEVILVGPHFEYRASASTDNLYKTIDVVMEKIEKQLSKRKDKMRSRIKKAPELVVLDPEAAWTDYDEEYFADLYEKAA
jgi:putative sigma-54 modulation protein